MKELINHRDARSAVLTGLGLAAVWVVAAVLRPTATFHLAPLLVGGVVPLLASRSQPTLRLPAAAVGAATATVAAVALGLFDMLRGPSLLPFGGALLEALVFAVVGSAAGMLVARIGVATPAG